MPKKKEASAEEVKPKKETVSLEVKFKAIDEDRNKVIMTFNSEGDSVAEALKKLDFPDGLNALVNVVVKIGAKEWKRALAPHKARLILGEKDEYEFNRLFR